MNIERTWVSAVSTNLGRAGAGGHPCQGLYHTPVGHRPRTAVIATHYNVDFSEHYMADYLAARGVGFLGWNTRFRGDDSRFLLDHALVDIGVGVEWLRRVAGVDDVILLGNSGGGSLMAVYQSQVVSPSVTPVAGMRPADGLDELSPADGYVSVAAHAGRPEVLTDWMDASVTDEWDPTRTDPSLDLWDENNGPPYSADFVRRYRRAQVARNERITDWVEEELDRLRRAGVHDRFFSVARTWADPRMVDPALDPSRRRPNSCYLGEPGRANRSVWGIASSVTLRTWLSLWSLRHSQARSDPHLRRVTVPSLIVHADADTGVFPGDADLLHDLVGADDKQRRDIPGDHYFREPDGARAELADMVVEWIAARFAV